MRTEDIAPMAKMFNGGEWAMIVGEYFLSEMLRLRRGFLTCVVGGLLWSTHDHSPVVVNDGSGVPEKARRNQKENNHCTWKRLFFLKAVLVCRWKRKSFKKKHLVCYRRRWRQEQKREIQLGPQMAGRYAIEKEKTIEKPSVVSRA